MITTEKNEKKTETCNILLLQSLSCIAFDPELMLPSAPQEYPPTANRTRLLELATQELQVFQDCATEQAVERTPQ